MLKNYPIINLSDEAKILVHNFNKKVADGTVALRSYPCISCGSDKKREIFTNDSHGINQNTVMCLNCGMVYSDPRMTPESQDKFYYSDVYRLLYDSYGDSGNYIAAANKKIASALSLEPRPLDASHYNIFSFYSFILESIDINEINSVCEIGAGSGANLLPFMKGGKRAYGVEISPGLVLNAKKHGIDLSYSSLEQVDKQIDLFILIHSLEHLHDPIEYLKNLTKLSPKYILIEVPGIVSKFGDSIQTAHNFYFSKNTLMKSCSSAGLFCVNIKYFRQNNFMLGLFKIDKDVNFEYNHHREIKKINAIIRIQKIKNMIPLQLKNLIKKVIIKNNN